MSDETGGQDAAGAAAEGPDENAAEPATAPAVPAAVAPAAPVAATETVASTSETGGSKRPGWLTPVLAGIAVLLLLGAGFGIGRWTDSGGDREMRFLNGAGFRGPDGRGGRGFGGPNGPSFGPRFGGPNGNSNGPNPNGPNGFGGGRGFFPGQNRSGQSNNGSNNGSNGQSNNGSSSSTTQPPQTLQ